MRIVLIHTTTKERHTVDAGLSTRLGFLIFRWGMSGEYTLNLANNVIQAVSSSTRLRHRLFTPWVAEDIHAVRKMVKVAQKDASEEEVQRARFAAHEASMPLAKAGDGYCGVCKGRCQGHPGTGLGKSG